MDLFRPKRKHGPGDEDIMIASSGLPKQEVKRQEVNKQEVCSLLGRCSPAISHKEHNALMLESLEKIQISREDNPVLTKLRQDSIESPGGSGTCREGGSGLDLRGSAAGIGRMSSMSDNDEERDYIGSGDSGRGREGCGSGIIGDAERDSDPVPNYIIRSPPPIIKHHHEQQPKHTSFSLSSSPVVSPRQCSSPALCFRSGAGTFSSRAQVERDAAEILALQRHQLTAGMQRRSMKEVRI